MSCAIRLLNKNFRNNFYGNTFWCAQEMSQILAYASLVTKVKMLTNKLSAVCPKTLSRRRNRRWKKKGNCKDFCVIRKRKKERETERARLKAQNRAVVTLHKKKSWKLRELNVARSQKTNSCRKKKSRKIQDFNRNGYVPQNFPATFLPLRHLKPINQYLNDHQ